jgi:hypothetical protein
MIESENEPITLPQPRQALFRFDAEALIHCEASSPIPFPNKSGVCKFAFTFRDSVH